MGETLEKIADMTSVEKGFIAGALTVVLLGEVIGALSLPSGDLTKLAYILRDVGVTGLSLGLLTEAVESDRSDTLRGALAIAGALVLLVLVL